jgi:hypothetical protein
MPGETLKPLYLFADSQLLFWKHEERRLLEAMIADLPEDATGAA